ncbi:MAG TPA: DUF167 domain-containing protein [Syntrophomonas sp.]|nr:DUF167 domain-containing protein [Syntrophomonas sp.]HRW13223.1 DUF167 domain-containing protein [Syntrophomonas sp.]
MTLKLTPGADGVCLEVQVQPRSSRNQVVGEQDGRLKIKLTAPPVEGEANQALVNFLAGLLHIPKKNIRLLRGESSRHKLIEIMGLNEAELIAKLNI